MRGQANCSGARRTLRKGRESEVEKSDYEGFSTRPISWERAEEKFERLAFPYADKNLQGLVMHEVRHLEEIEVRDLTGLLEKAGEQ
jgi:2-methylcitrate dehydratase